MSANDERVPVDSAAQDFVQSRHNRRAREASPEACRFCAYDLKVLNIGNTRWGCCAIHGVYWFVDYNKSHDWQEESSRDWEWNKKLLENWTRIGRMTPNLDEEFEFHCTEHKCRVMLGDLTDGLPELDDARRHYMMDIIRFHLGG